MAQQKPTVLFVHGAWHCPEHLAPGASVFEAAGYPTCCPRLPSYGAPEPKAANLSNDATAVRAQLDRLIEKEGRDVVVVLHSYGGMVGSEAVHASLGKSQRAAEGKPGGVLRLVYLTAFLLPEGVSMVSAANGVWPPFVTRNDDESLCFNLEPAQRLYHDVPPAEQQRCIALLKPHPVLTMGSPLTYCAYKHHPVSYIFCEDDQAVALEMQKAMADGAGVEVTTATLPSSHSPFLSMPEKLLEAVQKLAEI